MSDVEDRDDLDSFIAGRITDPEFARAYAESILAGVMAGCDGKNGNPTDWREVAAVSLDALTAEWFYLVPRTAHLVPPDAHLVPPDPAGSTNVEPS